MKCKIEFIKPYLKNVTLVIADCLNVARARKVLTFCKNICDFEDWKLFSDTDDIDVTKIEKLNSVKEYSRFIFKELYKHISTDFVLIVQHDGFIINSNKWSEDFLKYDYVGALWPPEYVSLNKSYLVGNGGFSLRSKRLMQYVAEHEDMDCYDPEDVAICQRYRPHLELVGFTFAPPEVAHRFSCERYIWNGSFGQHGIFILK